MDLKVFIATRESVCDECGEGLGHHAWSTLTEGKAFCLSCADLDHLIFLPSGDAVLTRRAGKYSTLSAVVLKWSRARKHYERQGLLVEESALQRAEQECLADEDICARRRKREAERRAELDQEYIQRFATCVHELFPNCPVGREYVIAHIHHTQTKYDELLSQGMDRSLARDEVSKCLREFCHTGRDSDRIGLKQMAIATHCRADGKPRIGTIRRDQT